MLISIGEVEFPYINLRPGTHFVLFPSFPPTYILFLHVFPLVTFRNMLSFMSLLCCVVFRFTLIAMLRV